MIDIEDFSKETFKFAEKMGYVKDWSRGGCYIHLEASEIDGIKSARRKMDRIQKIQTFKK